MLHIDYKTRRIERACTDYREARKQYGERMAIILHQRINELKSATSMDELVQYSVGRCHKLEGSRKGEYSMILIHPYRLVFKHDESKVGAVRVLSIEDYH